jgi:uncharacterized protein (TIGR03000 family)
MESTGSVRVFSTPPLPRGRTFTYTLIATLQTGGVLAIVTQDVSVSAGNTSYVTIMFPPRPVAYPVPVGYSATTGYGTWSYTQTNTNLDRAKGQDKFHSDMSITFSPNSCTVNASAIQFIQIFNQVYVGDGSFDTGQQ